MTTETRAPLPLFVVPAMPRAGTTFLYHYLQKHPALFLPFRKEIDYFNTLYHFKGRDWFESLYREMKPGQIAGDLSPACWFEPRTIEFIKEYNPDAKVILSLRDPAENTVSLYAQKLHSHYDLPPSVEDFLRDGYESRLTKQGEPVVFRFEDGDYGPKVKSYMEAFGSNLLVYDFEFFRRNQLTVLQAIEDFLGVEPYFNEENFDNQRINASERKNIKFLYHLTNYEWFRDLVQKCVPRTLTMKVRGYLDRASVADNPGKGARQTHSEEDIAVVRKHLERSCEQYRDLFKDYPAFTGDGREFKLRTTVEATSKE